MVAKINDVAKEANVSIATVSRVINNVPIVNGETKSRVEEAIKKLNYKPNAIARSLKLQKTNTIGVIIDDITRPYLSMGLRGIEDCCAKNGYSIILFNTYIGTEHERKVIDLISQKQCDGIIFLGLYLSEEISKTLSSLSVPVVLGILDEGKFSSVSLDEYAVGYDAASYFIKKGHEKIGYLNQEYLAEDTRLAGFKAALAENNITMNESWVRTTPISIDGGFEAMSELLKGDTEHPTAVYCINDDVACGAIRAIEKFKLKVPEDISIIGSNNSSIALWNNPAITTIGYDPISLGNELADALIYEMANFNQSNTNIKIRHEIIERDSVSQI
jgi:LacI family transcriptional regulator